MNAVSIFSGRFVVSFSWQLVFALCGLVANGSVCIDSLAPVVAAPPNSVSYSCPEIEVFSDTLHGCAGQTVNVSVQVFGDFSGVNWLGGLGAFSPDRTNLVVDYLPAPAESGTVVPLVVVAYPLNVGCLSDTDTVYVVVDVPPVVNAGPGYLYCGGHPMTLSAGYSGGANGIEWSGGAGVFDPDRFALNPTYHPAFGESGAVTFFVYAVTDGNVCPYDIDSSVVDIQDVAVDAGPDLHVCFGSAVSLSGIVSGAVVSGEWTGGIGKFIPSRASFSALYAPEGFEAGGPLQLVLLADSAPGCPVVSDTVVLFVDVPADVSVSGDIKGCPGDPFLINSILYGGIGSGHWTGGAGVFLPGIHDPTVDYYPDTAESGSRVRLFFISDTDSLHACPADSDYLDIQVWEQAVAFAGPDGSVCNASSYSVSGSVSQIANGGYWSTGGDGHFISPNLLSTSYIPGPTDILNGTVSLQLTPVYFGDCQPKSDALTLTVLTTQVNAGPDQTICSDGRVFLSATSTAVDSIHWKSSGDGYFSEPGLLSTTYYPGQQDQSAGSVVLIVEVVDAAGCSASDTMVLHIGQPFQASLVINQESCFGAGNAQVDVDILGGTAPFEIFYLDFTTGGSQSGTETVFDSLQFGDVLCIVTDSAGCYAELFGSIGITPPLELTLTSGAIACFGGYADVTLSALGGTPPYSGDSTYSVAAGTYQFSVTDINACTVTASVSLTEPAPVTVFIQPAAVLCHGGVAELSITASGGIPPYGGTGNSNVAAGTYTFTVTDMNGCTGISSVTVTEPPALVGTVVPIAASCSSCADGVLTITGISGGTPPYSYPLSDSISGLAPGNHCIVVVDSLGCQQDFCAYVSYDSCNIVVSAGPDFTSCDQNQFRVEGVVSGLAGVVSWSTTGDGLVLSPDSLATDYLPGALDVALGGVMLIIEFTVPGVCSRTDTVFVTLGSPPVAYGFEVHPVSCEGRADAAALISIVAGANPYHFFYGDFNSGDTLTSDSDFIDSLSAGNYWFLVEDINGCSATGVFDILPAQSLSASYSMVDSVSCYGGYGSLLLYPYNGVGPYSINGIRYEGDTISVQGGINEFWLTDATGCSGSVTLLIAEPDPIDVFVRYGAIRCFGDTSTVEVVAAGGVAPYFGTGFFEAVSGIVPYAVTDANGCSAGDTLFLTSPDPLSVTLTASPVSAPGNSDGYLQVSAVSGGTPGYQYVDLFNLSAGVYCIQVVDGNGCSITVCDTVRSTGCSISAQVVDSIPILCYGRPGAVFVSATDGVAPYTGTGLITAYAGTQSYTVTDGIGCSATATINLIQPAALYIDSIVSVPVSCFGFSDGSVDISVAGGVGSYSYQWNDGATSQDRTQLAATFYSVRIMDANGCSISQPVVIGQPDLLSAIPSLTAPSCSGSLNGSVSVLVNGGTLPFSYSWSNGDTNAVADSLSAGTYSLTVTDRNGCALNDTFQLTSPSPLVVSAVETDVACYDASTGSIELTVSGGTEPYHYLWTTTSADTTQDVSHLPGGTYTVYVTDEQGCSDSLTVTILQPQGPLDLQYVVAGVGCGALGSIDLTVAGGTGPYTYLWSNQSVSEDLTGLNPGVFSVIVTDANACTRTETFIVPVVSDSLRVDATVIDVSCYGGNDGAVDVTTDGGNGAYTYQWSNGSTLEDQSLLSVGTYSLVVTDANGCTDSSAYVIAQPSAALYLTYQSTAPNCSGFGSIHLSVFGGTLPYNYLWSNGSTSADLVGLSAGLFSVTVVDANGCSDSLTVNLENSGFGPVITGSVHPNSCFGDSAGSISLTVTGGLSPYTYLWSNGDTTAGISSLVNGVYSVSVSDANGCSAQFSGQITSPSQMILSGSITDVICFGATSGSVDISVFGGKGPYSYLWSNNETTEDVSGLLSGTYLVTATDGNGCTLTGSFSIQQPASGLLVTDFSTSVTCYGGSDGSLLITVSGGTPSYSFNWSDGDTTQSRSGLSAGVYVLTVFDSNGCAAVLSDTVRQPLALTVESDVIPVTCNGSSDGSIDLTVSGGVAPYSYTWIGSASVFEDISGLSAGTYGYVVTDANGCAFSGSAVVTAPSSLLLLAGISDVSCYGDLTGSIDLTVSGGVAPLSYAWTGGVVDEDRSFITAGTYTVVVTDAQGCSASSSYTVSQPAAALSLTASVSDARCNGTSTGSIDLSVMGGTPSYQYLWSNAVQAEDQSGIPAGNYSVTVTDGAGCTASLSMVVRQQDPILIGFQVSSVSCYGENNGSVNLSVSASHPPFSYVWSNGDTGQNPDSLTAGTYSVVVTDVSGCTETGAVTVRQPDLLQLTYRVTDAACNGGASGSIDLTVAGGTAPYAYLWSTGSPVQDISGLSAGLYEVSVLDSNECAAFVAIRVGEGSQLQTTLSASSAYCNVPGVISVSVTGGAGTYSYLWSSGQTTSTITHTTGGTFSVTVTDLNGCSTMDSVSVQRIVSLPDAAGPISGPLVVCHNTAVVYSIAPVPGATAYQWTLPGRATGWSNTNSISVTFQGSFQSGVICVAAQNGCGAGAASCINVLLTHTKPQAPVGITGTRYPCAPGTYTYSVSPVSGASGYDWTVTGSGSTIIAGNGTGTIVLATSAGFSGAILTVSAVNCNGTGQPFELVLYGPPLVGNALTGPSSPCPASTHNYSIADVPAAVSYSWSVTGNAVIVSSSGSSCSVRFNGNWNGGVLTVEVTNPCGTALQSFPLSGPPPAPATVTGPVSGLCVTSPSGSVYATYSCTPVPGATVYNWSLPRGMTIVSNSGTTIVVEVKKQFTSGSVCVSVGNGCSTGASACLFVSNLPAAPVVTGPSSVCLSYTGVTYNVSPVPGAVSYLWSSTNGARLSASGPAASVDFRGTIGATAVITAAVANACGTGPATAYPVAVNRSCRVSQAGDWYGVYPNPATDETRVRMETVPGVSYLMEVFDLYGRKLTSSEILAEDSRIELVLKVEEWSAGVYVIRARDWSGNWSREFRFVKE